jgi:hypothetical protein
MDQWDFMRSEAAVGVQRMNRRVGRVVVSVFWIGLSNGTLRAAEPVDFARDIRPIFSENCFLCHGPDATQRKADLRLDTRDGAFAKHEASFPVVAGKPDDSEVYLRITADDPQALMPPPKSGKKLTARQIDQDLDCAGGEVEQSLGV